VTVSGDFKSFIFIPVFRRNIAISKKKCYNGHKIPKLNCGDEKRIKK